MQVGRASLGRMSGRHTFARPTGTNGWLSSICSCWLLSTNQGRKCGSPPMTFPFWWIHVSLHHVTLVRSPSWKSSTPPLLNWNYQILSRLIPTFTSLCSNHSPLVTFSPPLPSDHRWPAGLLSLQDPWVQLQTVGFYETITFALALNICQSNSGHCIREKHKIKVIKHNLHYWGLSWVAKHDIVPEDKVKTTKCNTEKTQQQMDLQSKQKLIAILWSRNNNWLLQIFKTQTKNPGKSSE